MRQLDPDSQFKTGPYEYWQKLVKTKNKIIVFYGQNVLDLTEFSKMHIGGIKAIAMYTLKDVKNILFQVYPHSNQAISVLNTYMCGKLKNIREQLRQFPQHTIARKTKSILITKKQQKLKYSKTVNQKQKQNHTQITKQQQKSNSNCISQKKQQQNYNKNSDLLQSVCNQDQPLTFSQNKMEISIPYLQAKLLHKTNQYKI